MGVFGLIRGLFTGSTQVSESTEDYVRALGQHVIDLDKRINALQATIEEHYVELKRFRGRVYAWKGHEIPAEAPTEPAELPLNDPRVSKQELRARLLKPGKPFKHN